MNEQKRTSIKQALAAQEEKLGLSVNGWVRSLRRGKEVSFATLNDGSCFDSLQVVISPDLADYEVVTRVGTGACRRLQQNRHHRQGRT